MHKVSSAHIEHMSDEALSYSENRLVYFALLAKELIGRFHPSIVLDAGCGSAQLVFILHKLGVKAYGVDISQRYVSKAPPEIQKYLTCINIDSHDLPFCNGFFDLVVSHHSIEHFHNVEHFISEARRVLKPKGVVFIETPTPPFERSSSLLRALKIQQASKSVHPNTHSVSFWIRKFESEGFRKIGDLKPFIMRTCIDLDPPDCWWIRRLLKFGRLGKVAWHQLATYVIGTLLFEKQNEKAS